MSDDIHIELEELKEKIQEYKKRYWEAGRKDNQIKDEHLRNELYALKKEIYKKINELYKKVDRESPLYDEISQLEVLVGQIDRGNPDTSY